MRSFSDLAVVAPSRLEVVLGGGGPPTAGVLGGGGGGDGREQQGQEEEGEKGEKGGGTFHFGKGWKRYPTGEEKGGDSLRGVDL